MKTVELPKCNQSTGCSWMRYTELSTKSFAGNHMVFVVKAQSNQLLFLLPLKCYIHLHVPNLHWSNNGQKTRMMCFTLWVCIFVSVRTISTNHSSEFQSERDDFLTFLFPSWENFDARLSCSQNAHDHVENFASITFVWQAFFSFLFPLLPVPPYVPRINVYDDVEGNGWKWKYQGKTAPLIKKNQ